MVDSLRLGCQPQLTRTQARRERRSASPLARPSRHQAARLRCRLINRDRRGIFAKEAAEQVT